MNVDEERIKEDVGIMRLISVTCPEIAIRDAYGGHFLSKSI